MGALLDSFRDSFEALANREAAGLGESRRAALDAALGAGMPHARVEAWKYTPLRALERRAFRAPDARAHAFDATAIERVPAPRMVFVNGVFDARHSDLDGLPQGASLVPLSRVLAGDDPRDANFLARRFDRDDEIFARFNAALAVEGGVLRVEAGTTVEAPVHLVFIGTAEDGDRACHLRHLVELREGARLIVVEHHLGDVAHRHLSNHLLHAHLGADASLVHARVQDEDEGATVMARTDAVLARGAQYRRLDLELGASLSRHELNIALQGEGASAHANGVLLASGRRHLDTRLGIDHAGRDSRCELIWRGLGAGRSRAAFHGGILIREGADGTEATLSNKNLLLTEGAEIDSQPVLEIHADEVQAAHGATVGQLDPTALFYLRSRGIPAEQARSLLTAAFCRETVAVIEEASLRDVLADRLDAALARLEGAGS
ncbi:Fe-S cluster assembly protein SufD [Marilutibacter aestuarii]|uniref:Fe-S cluster assembly protein SufD n=1 Tax=Marilutibacter aestuarii TaxID=1706195 RepID=A0A508AE44_9GAMM|nr:Fe-S cluster assembly protein SufD [Lysobacter aestuarii]TQD48270.1 Fe-S cluster assembly protein SufD [Lysobacter aestuarii]